MATWKVYEVNEKGEKTLVDEYEADPAFSEELAKAQAEWKRLAEAGTPYWCIHEGRGVTHERAYWRPDMVDDPIHQKHGVFCADCGGYIQEG